MTVRPYIYGEEKKSKSWFDVMPWPPKQFNCGRCGFEYDGLVPKHDCGRPDAVTCDVFIMDFCTHCGETFNQYNGRHTCDPYGKHTRRTDLSEDAYFMRVTGFGGKGQHHLDPYKTQVIGVKDLVTQEISWKQIERQKTPQEIEWEHRKELDEDDLDDCLCDCDGCDYDVQSHCGDDFLGCHEGDNTYRPVSYQAHAHDKDSLISKGYNMLRGWL